MRVASVVRRPACYLSCSKPNRLWRPSLENGDTSAGLTVGIALRIEDDDEEEEEEAYVVRASMTPSRHCHNVP